MAYALATGVLIGAVVIDYAHVAAAAHTVRTEREPLAACLEVVPIRASRATVVWVKSICR